MSREKTEAVIYKLVRYSDSSAIASAFAKDFGRIKLFIPKAYTKKGGVVCFMPGNLDFARKDTDLSRFYSFESMPRFYHYLDNHEILMRLHLIFEVLDGLYQPEMADPTLFDLLLKYDDSNFRRLTPYLLYFILKRSGVMFDLKTCGNCGTDEEVFTINENGLLCSVCASQLCVDGFCDRESAYIIKSMASGQLYRNITVNRKQELQVLRALAAYCETVMEKPLKSLKTVMDVI